MAEPGQDIKCRSIRDDGLFEIGDAVAKRIIRQAGAELDLKFRPENGFTFSADHAQCLLTEDATAAQADWALQVGDLAQKGIQRSPASTLALHSLLGFGRSLAEGLGHTDFTTPTQYREVVKQRRRSTMHFSPHRDLNELLE